MKKLALSESGFITNYLISGPKLTEFTDDKVQKNQLNYEKYLRSIVWEKCESVPSEDIKLGALSEIGFEWEYYYSKGNWFVDVSDFYSLLKKVDLLAAVDLYVDEDMETAACLWTYAAVDVWLNGEHVCYAENPVYKPIMKKSMKFYLKKGKNRIFIKLQNLGVRDTRNIFGIQLLNKRDKITIALPDEKGAKSYQNLATWLSNIRLEDGVLNFSEPPEWETYLVYDSRNIDLTKAGERYEKINITGRPSIELKKECPYIIIEGIINNKSLTRRIEVVEQIKPQYSKPSITAQQNNELIYERIAMIAMMDRGEDVGFAMNNILARAFFNNKLTKIDEGLLYDTLKLIESRIDCSDFLMCGLLRYVKNYSVEEKLNSRIKEVILNYRYWMDQKGSDGMCFWSENHALMFYSCAMIAGKMYPEEYFQRADKTGEALFEAGRNSVLEWLLDIESDGYEEFLSAGYMCVTFGALLNVVDFGDDELSKKASSLVDVLLEQLSLHTFKGVVIAPQGRVYRDVVYPFSQGVQALINMVDPTAPYCLSEWLIFMATSKYRIPKNLLFIMNSNVEKEYSSGNALIKLSKTRNYIMTSVQSPREDKNPLMWDNNSFDEQADITAYLFVKSLNERFHGTTRFEPGVYGYQQHMWYAAIDIDTVVFANHPGGTFDGSSMRPGYWYGNGIMPAVKQQGNMIGSVYVISDNDPIHFTHLHWKDILFEKVIKNGNWIFGEKNGSYIGVWCSESLKEMDDIMFKAEYRAYSDKSAYLCQCGSLQENGSFDEFMTECYAINPFFDKGTLSLSTSTGFSMHYERHENLTQFI